MSFTRPPQIVMVDACISHHIPAWPSGSVPCGQEGAVLILHEALLMPNEAELDNWGQVLPSSWSVNWETGLNPSSLFVREIK